MNQQYQTAVTQPVREITREGLTFLRHEKTPRSVLESIAHLTGVIRFVESEDYRLMKEKQIRIIFLAEEEACARQAAMAFMSLHRKKQDKPVVEDRKGSLFAYALANFAEELEQKEYDEEKTEKGPFDEVVWSTDFLIQKLESERSSGDDLVAMQKEFGLSAQKARRAEALKRVDYLVKNVYVNCFEGNLCDEAVDAVRDLEKEIIVLAIPDCSQMQYYLRRLTFEQDFAVIRIPKPETGYYEKLLASYLEKCGVCTAEEVKLPALLKKLKGYRGTLFSECDIFRMVNKAVEHCGKEMLGQADFCLYGEQEIQSGMKKLNRMIGLSGVKRTILGLAALQVFQDDLADTKMHRNLVFSGPPGTGKSAVARLYGEILAETGVSNGKFVSAARQDMIGQYLGHTAVKIHALFERADGGVLFIDEAGSLAADDEYTRECITELVRYMEERPQTTVIFASYPDLIDAFLGKDPGLSSRIRKTVRFEAYTEEELCRIFRLFAQTAGWEVKKDAEDALFSYIKACRRQKKENFGNAREMRKLLEMIMENCCVRWLEHGKGSKKILAEDIVEAGRELLPEITRERMIGFAIGSCPNVVCR